MSKSSNRPNAPLNDWEIDFDDDGPSDTTVRPAGPQIREYLRKKEERYRRWQEEQRAEKSQPPESSKGPN
jgi:hypothetical protein